MNENKNTTYQHIRDTVKTVLRVNLQLQTPTLKERKKKKKEGREGGRKKAISKKSQENFLNILT